MESEGWLRFPLRSSKMATGLYHVLNLQAFTRYQVHFNMLAVSKYAGPFEKTLVF